MNKQDQKWEPKLNLGKGGRVLQAKKELEQAKK